MSDPTIDPVEEANQQRKAEHEAEEEEPPVSILEEAIEPLVAPFAREKLADEDVEQRREETDAEERSS